MMTWQHFSVTWRRPVTFSGESSWISKPTAWSGASNSAVLFGGTSSIYLWSFFLDTSFLTYDYNLINKTLIFTTTCYMYNYWTSISAHLYLNTTLQRKVKVVTYNRWRNDYILRKWEIIPSVFKLYTLHLSFLWLI